ncbi:hypothetical protein MMC08_003303 [Hypocenomyce scalaris]|nr:hypothetical protein [Hypocenomyce scalaris]
MADPPAPALTVKGLKKQLEPILAKEEELLVEYTTLYGEIRRDLRYIDKHSKWDDRGRQWVKRTEATATMDDRKNALKRLRWRIQNLRIFEERLNVKIAALTGEPFGESDEDGAKVKTIANPNGPFVVWERGHKDDASQGLAWLREEMKKLIAERKVVVAEITEMEKKAQKEKTAG